MINKKSETVRLGEVNKLITDVLEIANIKGLVFTKNKIKEIKNNDIDIYVINKIISTTLEIFDISQTRFNNNNNTKDATRKDSKAAAAFLIHKHTSLYQKEIAGKLGVADRVVSDYISYISNLGNLKFELEIKDKIEQIETIILENGNK